MKPVRAWVRLDSGLRLNLLEPDPISWTHRDLAIGLARTYRWGGHSCWSRPLSVAQHSLPVLALRQRASLDHALDRGEPLRELLHDADEGMLSFDPVAPLKPHLGTDYESLVIRLRTAVASRYGLPDWTAQSYANHKAADLLAAASEPCTSPDGRRRSWSRHSGSACSPSVPTHSQCLEAICHGSRGRPTMQRTAFLGCWRA